MNSISNFFGGGGGPFAGLMNMISNVGNWINQLQQFSKNPIGAIMSMKGVNVPQNFNGTPEDLAKYLLNTNQMSQADFQRFSGLADQMQSQLPNTFFKR